MIVYRIKNLLNGKLYIGQTTQCLNLRWNCHCSPNGCTGLFRAIKKYGRENFEIKVLSRCDSIDEMNHREQYYIQLFKTLAPNGYNLRTGGHNSLPSEETRFKMSLSQKGRKKNKPAWNKGKSSWSKGIPHSPEHNKAISMSHPRRCPIIVSDGRHFDSISEAAKALKTTSGRICAVLNGTRRHTRGYTFERKAA